MVKLPKMELFKDELVHFSLSLIIGVVLGEIFGSPLLIPFCLLFGFFIDADHLTDYFYCFFRLDKETRNKNLFNIIFHFKHFFTPKFYVLQSRKVIVPLHGWEYIPIFWFLLRSLGNILGIDGLEWVVIAYIAHLSWDQHTGAGTWRSYFFIHRLKNRFSYEAYEKN